VGPQYTKCFAYQHGPAPFHEDDLAGLFAKNGTLGAVFGVLTGLAVGFAVGGPAGAVIGALVGAFAAGYAATVMAITQGANNWLNHRLVCLGGRKCAVGTVKADLEIAGLGEFDNDQYFDLALMPYPPDKAFDVDGDPDAPAATQAARAALEQFPKNRVFTDNFQGEELVHPRSDLLQEIGYYEAKGKRTKDIRKFRKNWLHCEAEGDFWVRMSDLALAMGVLGGLTTATAVGGAIAGGVAGCALGGWFGIIGCIVGAIIGAIVGLVVAGAAAAAATKAIVESIFETNPGDVEDANVGDKALGPIRAGDRVVVFGEHVYDGFHEGWHEIHPLLTICKIGTFKLESGTEESFYLQWDPAFAGDRPFNEDLPGLALPKLIPEDMRKGLESTAFAARARALKDRWCGLLGQRFDPAVIKTQQGIRERWTIHPAVDGCAPSTSPPGLH
jgi:hypothetical protein